MSDIARRPPLFRSQALDFQRSSRQAGNVALLQPVSYKLTVWFLVAIFAAILAFLSVGQYARKETAQGYLTPASGTGKVYASTPGVITEVYVREGEQVEQGRPLLSIATAQIAADGQDVNAAMLGTLKLQRDLLREQIGAEQDRVASERERLVTVIRGLAAQIAQFQAQIATQGDRIKLADSLVGSAAQLVTKGYLSELEFKRRQENVLEQKQGLNALTRQLGGVQNELAEARAKLDQLPTVMAEKIGSLRGELSAAEQRMTELEGKRAYVIRASMSGRVATIQAKPGAYADPRHLQLEILPEGSQLQAELFVPTRAAGFVKPGQPVRILYDAFPYQSFGAYRGSIVTVSKTIVTQADSTGPITLKEPCYRASVALERPDVDAHGEIVPLQADMSLRADIILERRSLGQWLLAPLLSAARRL